MDVIAVRLTEAGLELATLSTSDLASVDEFHIRGCQATLELGERMRLNSERWPRCTGVTSPASI